MSFLGFLKGAGKVLGIGLRDAVKLAPVAEEVAGVAGFPEVAIAIKTFEGVFAGVEAVAVSTQGLPGPDKLKMAVPAIESVIKNSGWLNGRQIADLSKWDKAIADLSSAFVDLSNSTTPATTVPAGG